MCLIDNSPGIHKGKDEDFPPEYKALTERLHYDADAGLFSYRKGPRAGMVVSGYKNERGYIILDLKEGRFRAHRLAWLFIHKRWPEKYIDHINGLTSDNRIENLREADHSQNLLNMRVQRRNSRSGIKGVCWHAREKRWRATFTFRRKSYHIGLFNTKEEALEAYREKALALGGEFSRVSALDVGVRVK